jgi:hypothetical protein
MEAKGIAMNLTDLPEPAQTDGEFRRWVDPETGQEYVLVPAEQFQKFKAVVDSATRRADWNDPALDVYEQYRKRP